jgi:chemotaxis protein MotB
MSSKVLALLGVSLSVLTSVGCAGSAIQRDELTALKRYNEQLEREATDLRKFKQAYETLKEEIDLTSTESKMLEDLRTALLEALKGVSVDGGDVQYDPKRGVWTMGGDLLFDSGSIKVTPKGEEVLKKFAETYKGKAVTLRIVGHTDRDPIAKAGTKQLLQFDHNVELGALRACSVFMTLSKHGVAPTRMFVESWGNNNPVAQNDTKTENKKKNRRVEIFILAETVTPGHR